MEVRAAYRFIDIPCLHAGWCQRRFWCEPTDTVQIRRCWALKSLISTGMAMQKDTCTGVSGVRVQMGSLGRLPTSTSVMTVSQNNWKSRVFVSFALITWGIKCMQQQPFTFCSNTMHYQCKSKTIKRRCNMAQRTTYFSAYQPFLCYCYRYSATPWCLRTLLRCQRIYIWELLFAFAVSGTLCNSRDCRRSAVLKLYANCRERCNQ